jgi:hypothetical protein
LYDFISGRTLLSTTINLQITNPGGAVRRYDWRLTVQEICLRVSMIKDSTKPFGSWDIRMSSILYNLVFLLLILAVSYLFDLTIISAVLWCMPLIPAWWLVTREARIKTNANALNNAFPCSDQIPRKAPCV